MSTREFGIKTGVFSGINSEGGAISSMLERVGKTLSKNGVGPTSPQEKRNTAGSVETDRTGEQEEEADTVKTTDPPADFDHFPKQRKPHGFTMHLPVDLTLREGRTFGSPEDRQTCLDIYCGRTSPDAPVNWDGKTVLLPTRRGKNQRPLNKDSPNVYPYVLRQKQDRYWWKGGRRPHIRMIDPDHGSPEGGQCVMLHGSGYGANSSVALTAIFTRTVGDEEQRLESSCTWLSPTQLLVCTPRSPNHGKYCVQVSVDGVRSELDCSRTLFEYDGPRIVELLPRKIAAEGGTTIQVKVNFSLENQDIKLTIGGEEYTDFELDDMYTLIVKVRAVDPKMAGDRICVRVVATAPDGTVTRTERTAKTQLTYFLEEKSEAPPATSRLLKVEEATPITVDLADLLPKSNEFRDEQMENVCRVLEQGYHDLREIFRYYAMDAGVSGEDDPSDISNRQFRIFCEESRLVGDRQVGRKLGKSKLDIVFIRANRGGNDRCLDMPEFLGAVVRLANEKFIHTTVLADRVKSCLKAVFEYAKRIDKEDPFLQVHVSEEAQKVYTKHKNKLLMVYKGYAQAGGYGKTGTGYGTVDLSEMELMVKELKLDIPKNDLRRMFFLSNMQTYKIRMLSDECECEGLCRCPMPRFISLKVDHDNDNVEPEKKQAPKRNWLEEKENEKEKETAGLVQDAAAESFSELGYEEFLELMSRLLFYQEGVPRVDERMVRDLDVDEMGMRTKATRLCQNFHHELERFIPDLMFRWLRKTQP